MTSQFHGGLVIGSFCSFFMDGLVNGGGVEDELVVILN